MKMSLFVLLFAFISSCGNTNEAAKPSEPTVQEAPAETPPAQQGMIVGKFTKEDLQKEPYASWFNSGFESFDPADEAMETIKNNISEYEIVLFMGTWCPDSRREVPKLLKILDEANYDLSNLTMIGVDRSKTTPEKLEAEYDLERVPTIIFIKDGKEVNRFVEYAKESIEADIAKIVSGEEYTHAYSN